MLGISENPILETPETAPTQKYFAARRFFTIAIISLSDMLVFFQRATPAIVVDPMAKSYGLKTTDLSIFSSMFFYPYAIIQPFAGLLADVVDTRYLIGISSLIAAFGALICGLSKTLFVGCIGRFLVGLGSAPIYVPACRTIANWFPLSHYSRCVGIFCAVAGCGGLVAQGPFSYVAEKLSWQWCFYLVAIAGFVLSTLVLIFVRGNPVSLGYKAVNEETAHDSAELNIKQKFIQLCNNFKTVVKNGSFWLIGLYNFGINGAYFDINGMWGGPYLKDVYGYSLTASGNIMMAISLGNVIGPLLLPFIAEPFNTRKWFVFVGSLIAVGSLIPFAIVDQLPTAAIVALFFVYAMFSNSMTNVAYPMCREYFHGSVAGSAIGCQNIYAYISTIIYQTGTGLWLEKFEIPDNPGHYSAKGYKIALWWLSIGSSIFGTLAIIFAKDTRGKKIDNDQLLISSSEYQSLNSVVVPE